MCTRTIVLLLTMSSMSFADVVYVSSLNNHEVLRYDVDTGAYVDTLIPTGSGGLSQPHAIFDRCDDLLVCSFGTDNVLRYDRESGAYLGVFIDDSDGLSEPTYLLRGADGLFYISSQGSDQIHRYDANGSFVDVFVIAGSGGLDGPSGFAFGPDGRLYVSGRYSANVIAYDGSTGAFDEVIADAADGLGAGSTFGLNFGDNGDLYFASNGLVYRYDLDTDAVLAMIPLGSPIGIESGPPGLVTVATANNLRFIDTTDDTVSAPFLVGGVINTLNFFHVSTVAQQPECDTTLIPATSAWGVIVLLLLLMITGVCVLRGDSLSHRRA